MPKMHKKEMFVFKINNRRYLGSKAKLLPFINEIVDKYCHNCKSFTDLFAGTGVVAHHFNSKYSVRVNDILKSNVYAYETFLSPMEVDEEKLKKIIIKYNHLDLTLYPKNYYEKHFADTFLSKENMKRVGIIRDDIDKKTKQGQLNKREEAILITSLLYAIDKIANTVGHYDAFRRNGKLDQELVLLYPELNDEYNLDNQISCMDANEHVTKYESDIVYIDPPYNSRQYCDAYHFLENVAENNKPPVFGVARKMDRSTLKSVFCSQKAPLYFEKLIDDIKAKYILISYNNTGDKINARSNAKLHDEDIINALSKKGKVSIYEQEFNAFTTGKTSLNEHKERLFVCEVGVFDSKLLPDKLNIVKTKKNSNPSVIRSPLNYTGGKAKLFPQISKFFSSEFKTFYDVFSGGANVAVNMSADKIICVDNNKQLIELFNFMKGLSTYEIETSLDKKIKYYGLSDTYRRGYEFYNCNSSQGLGKFNKEKFIKLKEDYNKNPQPLLFLLVVIYSFNNQIRFNKQGEFNLPVGKRDFNSSLRKKLYQFHQSIVDKDIQFINLDFRDLDIDLLKTQGAFLYLDPPYLLGTASYNENGQWTEADETDLLSFLTRCNLAGLSFALSNTLKHKGLTHQQLLDWAIEGGFNINYLRYNYANSNYQIKNRKQETDEVLITNY